MDRIAAIVPSLELNFKSSAVSFEFSVKDLVEREKQVVQNSRSLKHKYSQSEVSTCTVQFILLQK